MDWEGTTFAQVPWRYGVAVAAMQCQLVCDLNRALAEGREASSRKALLVSYWTLLGKAQEAREGDKSATKHIDERLLL